MSEEKLDKEKELAVRQRIMKYQVKVQGILDSMEKFSWDELKRRFYAEEEPESDTKLENPVYNLFVIVIKELEESKRVGNAKFMRCERTH